MVSFQGVAKYNTVEVKVFVVHYGVACFPAGNLSDPAAGAVEYTRSPFLHISSQRISAREVSTTSHTISKLQKAVNGAGERERLDAREDYSLTTGRR